MPAIVSRQAAQPLENDKIKVNDRPPFTWKGGFSIGVIIYEEDNHTFIGTVRFNGLWQKRGHI